MTEVATPSQKSSAIGARKSQLKNKLEYWGGLRQKIFYEIGSFFKKSKNNLRSFFKQYLFGDAEAVQRYKKQSFVITFLTDLNNSLDTKYRLLRRIGFITLFLGLVTLTTCLAFIRTKPKEQLQEQIRISERIPTKMESLDSYHDLQDTMRKQSSLLFNNLCKYYNAYLVNFEAQYKTLDFAAKRKDVKTLKALHLQPAEGNLYFKTDDGKYLLIFDTAKLRS